MCRVAARWDKRENSPLGRRNVDEVDAQEITYLDEDCLVNNIAIVVIGRSVEKSKIVLFKG